MIWLELLQQVLYSFLITIFIVLKNALKFTPHCLASVMSVTLYLRLVGYYEIPWVWPFVAFFAMIVVRMVLDFKKMYKWF